MRRLLFALLLSFSSLPVNAQAFDLIGPKVDLHVKRGDLTLPAGQVPNLLPGDRLWIHPDFPESQAAHYILIVAFLRGITNPPPNDWFTRVDTWNKAVREEGVFVTVPADAQQAVLFLAPETGGDFSTLRNAVRGRPGIFVRAAQDLQLASWDRMRLDAFLAEVKVTSQTDPNSLKQRAEISARSLGIKINQECFDKPIEQQATCLSAHTEGLVMDDSSAQTRVAQIANGSTADLMNQLAYTPVGGAGVYSPYVGAIVDGVRILSQLHTAHYQYLPALALSSEDTLNLRLSVPPSFRDPKSVVVVALPPIGPAKMPPLHPIDPKETYCAQKPDLILPAGGAPLVLATQLAHNLVLHIDAKSGAVDLPLTPDPGEGGLALVKPAPLLTPSEITGEVRGKWGFDDWIGPIYRLHSAQPGKWSLSSSDQSALVVGREDTLHIQGESSLCIEKIDQVTASGTVLPLTWKSQKADVLTVSVPMADATPGRVKIEVHQFGIKKPDVLSLNAYAEAASLERLSFSSGDPAAVLTGTRLDEVAKASLNGVTWSPAELGRVQDTDRLTMKADNATASLEPGQRYVATVQLRDGRELKVHTTVLPTRPQIALLSKGTQDPTSDADTLVHLGSQDDLPVDKRLVFFLKSKVPANFPRDEKIEVAAEDGSFRTVLSLADGSLMLEDSSTALGVVEPLNRFGSSAFGPIQARPVSADGVAGDWQPLGTLVRLPGFKDLRCPRSLSRPCSLSGSNLFLATSFAATPAFDNPTDVPPDFTGTQLAVPHATGGTLYVKLRDDPGTVQTLTMPVTPATVQAVAPIPVPAAPQETTAPQPKPEGPPSTAPSTQPSVAPPASPSTPPATPPSVPPQSQAQPPVPSTGARL